MSLVIIIIIAMTLEFYVSDKRRKGVNRDLSKYFSSGISKVIEKGIYNFAQQFCMNNAKYLDFSTAIYDEKVRDLSFNFVNNSETTKKIIRDIEALKFNPYNLAFLKPEELDFENWRRIIEKKANIEKRINDADYYEWKPCENCHGTKYKYIQMQTRSADEPMTTFFICVGCSKIVSENN